MTYVIFLTAGENILNSRSEASEPQRKTNALVVSQRKADSWRFESSQERYNRFCREYPDVVSLASVTHIASYLLMSPETLSRVRAGVL